jgi:hypothetical protein
LDLDRAWLSTLGGDSVLWLKTEDKHMSSINVNQKAENNNNNNSKRNNKQQGQKKETRRGIFTCV